MYEFKKSLKDGEDAEARLDNFFSCYYKSAPIDRHLQRAGIDRVFTENGGRKISVEYKRDDRAAQTGNAFMELVSVEEESKPGWVYTSLAQLLIYYIPPTGELIAVPMLEIKNNVGKWAIGRKEIRIRSQNNGKTWHTIGFAIPLELLREKAIYISSVN